MIFKKDKKETTIVRKALRKDAREIAQLIAAEYGHTPQSYYQRTLQDLDDPLNKFVCLVEIDNKIVGYGRLKRFEGTHYPYPGPNGWYLMGLLVHPKFRKKGIAKKIIKFRMDFLEKISTHVYYVTNETNAGSIKAHERYGFKEIERGKGFMSVEFQNEKGILFKKVF